jgi:hypothetical protein
MEPATSESADGAKPVLRTTRVPKNAGELASYYLELAYRIDNHISTTRLPSLLISLALSVFAAGATLCVYEGFWFKGAEFIGFALFAIALLAAGVVVHVAELSLPRRYRHPSTAAENGSTGQAPIVTEIIATPDSGGGPAKISGTIITSDAGFWFVQYGDTSSVYPNTEMGGSLAAKSGEQDISADASYLTAGKYFRVGFTTNSAGQTAYSKEVLVK